MAPNDATPSNAGDSGRLGRRDLGLLAAFSLALFGLACFSGRSITTHEAVHCQNVREMLADHDWIIPHYGGRIWLERPPLPHWATAAVVAISGQTEAEWPYRLSAALAGALIALQIGWIASVWFGRGVGLLAGATFATTRTGFGYSTGAESDIFLALIVTTVVALFVRIEFVLKPSQTSFLGRRPWELLAMCVVLGLTNSAKGLFFGMVLASLPLAGFVLGQWSWSAVRRYVWFWGLLGFAVASLAWPVAAYLREPGVVDLWKSDYLGRLNKGFIRAPVWYYLSVLPWCLFPWSATALLGFGQAVSKARDPRSPERFLLLWAVLPVLFLTIPQGKHHHYLLPVLAPWCILSAVAAERAWAWLRSFPRWLRHPLTTASIAAVLGAITVMIYRERITASDTMLAVLVAGAALYAGLFRWALDQSQRATAAIATCGLIGVGFLVFEGTSAAFGDSYRFDRRFVTDVPALVPAGKPLMVVNDNEPLDSSWMLFYLPDNTRMLHNLTFLLSEELREPEVYVMGRGIAIQGLDLFGSVEEVLRSEQSRGLKTDSSERWGLYRVRLRPDRPRVSETSVRINPMQATGRAAGPFLVPSPAFASAP